MFFLLDVYVESLSIQLCRKSVIERLCKYLSVIDVDWQVKAIM